MSIDHTPIVFISYSWSSEKFKEKILNFAKRLRNNAVDVILDQWDLKEGQDKYAFMEQTVSRSDVDKVLIICDATYCLKADRRDGGVGAETTIITPELFLKSDQTKFIPLVFEHNEDETLCLPACLKSRIAIDFTNEEMFEKKYEELLRNIFDEPEHKKPPLGKRPDFSKQDNDDLGVHFHNKKRLFYSLEHDPESDWDQPWRCTKTSPSDFKIVIYNNGQVPVVIRQLSIGLKDQMWTDIILQDFISLKPYDKCDVRLMQQEYDVLKFKCKKTGKDICLVEGIDIEWKVVKGKIDLSMLNIIFGRSDDVASEVE